jgi:hypothetical protein
MTLEPDRIHSESVELKNINTTTKIIIGTIMAAVIIGFSVIPALTTSSSKGQYNNISDLKRALCTSKVLELAQKGAIRDAAGYYGGLSECMAMKSTGSIYGEAGAAT